MDGSMAQSYARQAVSTSAPANIRLERSAQTRSSDRPEHTTAVRCARGAGEGRTTTAVRYWDVDLVMPARPPDASTDGSYVVPIQPAVSSRLREFEDAYRAHYRDVHRYLLAFTGSTQDAEEIAAETFERALRTWVKTPNPPLPWLLLTARRIATDRWRRARRWAQIALGLRGERSADAGERQTEFWLWFDQVSRLLTDKQREVLLLRYQRDLTDADIARIMAISESGVRSLASRALAVLRAHPELL